MHSSQFGITFTDSRGPVNSDGPIHCIHSLNRMVWYSVMSVCGLKTPNLILSQLFKQFHSKFMMPAHRPLIPQVQSLTILRVLQYHRCLYLSIGPMTPLLSQQKFYPAPCHRVICLTFAHQN